MKNVIIIVLSLITLTSCGQTQPNAEISDSVKTRIDSLFSEFDNLNSPGYAIGISKNGKTLYKKGYGSSNLDYNIPIETSSVFSIASVSKQFTAACIALLILEKKVSLETPVSDFIPELNKYADTIRIKHLIYNTSGITDYPRLKRKSGKSWITFNYFDIDECISTSLVEDTLQFSPGDKWDYCNVNYMLLTKIVEKISGQSFSEFAKTRLFEPLEMHNTLINDDITSVIKNRVTPYNLRTKENLEGYNEYGIKLKKEGEYIQHARNSPHYGGSGVVTSIDDLLKWSSNMTSKKFGGQEFYDLMHKTIKFNHDRDNQAFGLYIGDFNGRKIVAWDGGDWGISSQLFRFPNEGIAIIVLSNIGSGEAYRKVNGIADILIDGGILK
ncbi:MAG TPA: serine hydrolase domain-containing protein [Saprospiraceae bacterium]|nr:serine hydrolase domain-containing protein [Saprospiraceae bacterium]HMQ84548.1 serine hydrolase domain-containing protein [Saprospiraceae bacterium]